MELLLKNYESYKKQFIENNIKASSVISSIQTLEHQLMFLQQEQIKLTGLIKEIQEISGKSIPELDSLLKGGLDEIKKSYPDNVVPIHGNNDDSVLRIKTPDETPNAG